MAWRFHFPIRNYDFKHDRGQYFVGNGEKCYATIIIALVDVAFLKKKNYDRTYAFPLIRNIVSVPV